MAKSKRVLPYWLKPKPDKCPYCHVLIKKNFEEELSYHDPCCYLVIDSITT